MPSVDLVDETFVVADRADVAAALRDPKLWRTWWPDLELRVTNDRKLQGLQFDISGALVGNGELWLEPWGDGVIVHFFLRAEPTRPGSATEPRPIKPRQAWREIRRRAWQTKRGLAELKDRLEQGRAAGEPRPGAEPAEPAASAATKPVTAG